MRKASFSVILFVVLSIVLGACGSPPPLKSDKYLADTSLLSQDPCAPPCFQEITAGKTTFTDALDIVKKKTDLFSNVQSQDNPKQAVWSTKDGETCCQIVANDNTGIIDIILVRVKPTMTVSQVIAKYGPPKYISAVDYTPDESALTLIFPDVGLVTWIVPGDAKSSVTENTPVVAVLYLTAAKLSEQIDMAALQGWDGYKSYEIYKAATPIITPKITVTPGS